MCNISVIEIETYLMLHSPENVPAFIESVKRREKTLSGFGHRCVSNFIRALLLPAHATCHLSECTGLYVC